MPLREPLAVLADDERDVREPGRRERERAVEQELSGGRGEEIVAAHDVRDLHRRVVDDDRELVRRDPVGAGDDEVADAARDVDRRAPCTPSSNATGPCSTRNRHAGARASGALRALRGGERGQVPGSRALVGRARGAWDAAAILRARAEAG